MIIFLLLSVMNVCLSAMDSSLERLEITPQHAPKKIITPLRYFGQREHIVDDLFRLLPTREYETLFDPFCGSGSISFAAMDRKIARSFVMNDSYPVLTRLWGSLKDKTHKTIIKMVYMQKCNELFGLDEAMQKQKYADCLRQFNTQTSKTMAAGLYLFLNNHAEDHMPVFSDDKKLATKFAKNNEDSTVTIDRIDLASNLLQKNNVVITNENFLSILKHVSSGDAVIFDPPYPTMADGIYFNTRKADQLHDELKTAIVQLNEKDVPFAMSYGAGDVPAQYHFDEQELNVIHLIRVTCSPVFGPYLEHVYIPKTSEAIVATLPDYIIRYVSYEDAKQKLLGKK